MTAEELINKLKECPKDTPIYCVFDYDYFFEINGFENKFNTGLFIHLKDIPIH